MFRCWYREVVIQKMRRNLVPVCVEMGHEGFVGYKVRCWVEALLGGHRGDPGNVSRATTGDDFDR